MHDQTWDFITTGENTGEFNMRFDEMLVRRLIEGSGSPTLRLYQWSPWALSIGHHQNLSHIDVQHCKDSGIDVVRRPTGGRAILHAEELTYSVVMKTDQRGIHRVYNEISEALVEGLRFFRIAASLQRVQPNFTELYRNQSSIPCFSSSARYEIECNGKKLVGSAQRRYACESEEVVLQHGSILCGSAHRRLADFLATDVDVREVVRNDLDERTSDLHQVSGREVDLQELSNCLKKGFESAWGITFIEKEHQPSTTKSVYA